MSKQSGVARFLATAAVTAMLAASLGGCQTMSDVTGALTAKADPAPDADPQRIIDYYGERYRANPKDIDAALAYGQALRANGQRAQAAAVLEQACIANPGNKPLLAGWGRALADNGNFQQAFDVLSSAHTPENPDWRILSVQGTTLDQLGRHDEARRYYASALKIVPDEPQVLSNIGLSYLLSKDLPLAEETLRKARERAPADMRVRTNLAVVVGLQGRQSEAETIMKADLSPEEGTANVAALKRLLARKEAVRSEKIPVATSKHAD